jgi:hypothetical protein
MPPLGLLKNFKHKYIFYNHIQIHVLILNASFNQSPKTHVDCVIIDLVQIEVEFKNEINVWNKLLFWKCMGCKITLGRINGGC